MECYFTNYANFTFGFMVNIKGREVKIYARNHISKEYSVHEKYYDDPCLILNAKKIHFGNDNVGCRCCASNNILVEIGEIIIDGVTYYEAYYIADHVTRFFMPNNIKGYYSSESDLGDGYAITNNGDVYLFNDRTILVDGELDPPPENYYTECHIDATPMLHDMIIDWYSPTVVVEQLIRRYKHKRTISSFLWCVIPDTWDNDVLYELGVWLSTMV